MPHQCVRCNKFYDDGASEILKGCKCGGKLFFFVKKDKLEEVRNLVVELTPEEKEQIETDVLDIIGTPQGADPVVLDLESVRILKPGKYEIDLVHLFQGQPLIYKVEDGKYLIDIVQSFKQKLGKG